jgi:hypothetical protein
MRSAETPPLNLKEIVMAESLNDARARLGGEAA